jgi:hypothetical protein
MKTNNSVGVKSTLEILKSALAVLTMTWGTAGYAGEIDLTGTPPPPPSAQTVNSAIFQLFEAGGSSGTGVLEPFLRLQANGTEEGYNVDHALAGSMPDVKTGSWTHDFQLSYLSNQIVGIVQPDNTVKLYYQFLLDYAENDDLLSIDEIQIYTGPKITSGGNTLTTITGDASYTLRYDLDAGGDNWIKLNDPTDSGNGTANLIFLVPLDNFTGASMTDYVYFYTSMGNTYSTSSSFEEWGVLKGGVPEVPEPASMLFGALLLGCLAWRERSLFRTALAKTPTA